MPVITAAIIGGGLALAGNAMSSSEQAASARAANRQRVALTHEQMEWEEKMRGSAHQAEVKDLRAAGLNPILSAGGGGGSWHSVSAPQVETEPATQYGDVAGAASSAAQAVKQMDLIDAQTRKVNAEAQAVEQDLEEGGPRERVGKTREEARLTRWDFTMREHLSGEQVRQAMATTDKLEQDVQRGAIDLKVAKQQLQNLVQDYKIGQSAEAQAQILKAIYAGDEGTILKYLQIIKDLMPWGNLPRMR